jgi:ParB-like chromosome segregation protein Spo0J
MTTPTTKLDYRNLTIHPSVKDLFPPMEPEGLKALAADIKANELKEPICLYEGFILDGNNRYRAFFQAGLEYKLTDQCFCQFDPKTQGDPLTFVVSANLHRRHLTESQRAMIAGQIVTTKLGSNQYKGKDGKIDTAKAAELLAVSETSVKRAKKVYEKAAPEVVDALRKGDLRLGMAVNVVAKPKEQQTQAMAEEKAKAEAQKAAARTKRDAAKAGKPQSAKASEANQRMIDLDTFKKKWDGFNDMQRRSFVETYRSDLQTILDKIAEHEAYQHAAE